VADYAQQYFSHNFVTFILLQKKCHKITASKQLHFYFGAKGATEWTIAIGSHMHIQFTFIFIRPNGHWTAEAIGM